MPSKTYRDCDNNNEIECYFTPSHIIVTTSDDRKKKSKLGFYIFCLRWLWKNRDWENTRQKFKAMEKAYKEYKRGE